MNGKPSLRGGKHVGKELGMPGKTSDLARTADSQSAVTRIGVPNPSLRIG